MSLWLLGPSYFSVMKRRAKGQSRKTGKQN
jgi:hypothetical protein